ncbi:ppfA [Escherichia coli]|nr:ppfA [Escherichia coli]
MEKIGSLDQAVKERDKSISDLNQTIETMNKADQHFHSQEVKNESEQAKYADRQMERKAEVQKQLVASGSVRQRIPVDTQRLLRESISEFNADADKG